MNFNRLKYYIIMAVLVALIVCVVAFTGYDTTTGVIDSLPDDPSIETPENPEVEDPNDDAEESETLPNFKSWNKLWEYSLDIAMQGYSSSFTMEVDANSVGVSAVQSFKGTEKYNAKEQKFKNEYFTTNSNPLAGGSATYYEYALQTSSTLEKRKTENINFSEGTYTFTDEPITVTEQQFQTPSFYGLRGLTLNTENVNLILFDKISNSSYYIIRLDYKLDKLTEGYYNGFLSTGLVDSVDIKAISIEIRVNKKNGHLYSIKTTEEYINYPSFIPVSANCVSVAMQVFDMNEDVVI